MAPVRDAEGVRVGNRFLVGEILGEGSFSVVYAALDEETGTPVALKVIGRDASDDALMEASLLSALRHPNVVSFYAAGSSVASKASPCTPPPGKVRTFGSSSAPVRENLLTRELKLSAT